MFCWEDGTEVLEDDGAENEDLRGETDDVEETVLALGGAGKTVDDGHEYFVRYELSRSILAACRSGRQDYTRPQLLNLVNIVGLIAYRD